MADTTKIEWTDATWQIVTGCSVVSPGCTNCYAMKLAGTRLRNHPSREGLTVPSKAGPVWNGMVRFNVGWLKQPIQWKKPRDIFVAAHGDLFHDAVQRWMHVKVWAVMAIAHWHRYQVLTKRAERMAEFCQWLQTPEGREAIIAEMYKLGATFAAVQLPLRNVWLGVSVEDQARANERIPHLLRTPAAVRWISAEPLLGPLDLRQWLFDWGCGCGYGGHATLDHCPNCGWVGDGPTIEHELGDVVGDCPECSEELSDYYACPECKGTGQDGSGFGPNSAWVNWIVAGGESGPFARPAHPNWIRSLRDQCAAAEVPFFFKQWGAWHADALLNTDVATGQCPPPKMRVGKKAAGALLDGREHREFPV